MADGVRYIAEEMIPELEDFEKRGYFTKAEIKQMVKKRLQFEYLLKRKIPLKADFLRYIEYEERLEALRVHRREERGMGAGGKHTLAEWAIPRRIHFIYDRALRRFKGDLDLWTRWLRHCRAAKSPRQMSKVLARALQLHPKEPRLWSHAAGFEFEDHHNPAAARLLLQRGLRLCPQSTHLWIENFRLELLYAHQLGTRRQILGLDAGASHAESHEPDLLTEDLKQDVNGASTGPDPRGTSPAAAGSIPSTQDPAEAATQDGSRPASPSQIQYQVATAAEIGDDDQLSLLEQLPPDPMEAGDPLQGSLDTQGASSDDGAGLQALLQGGIARVVFRSAAEAHPGRLDIRASFLDTLRPFTFPGVAKVSQEILADVAAHFTNDPQAWDLRARLAWQPIGAPSPSAAGQPEHVEAATSIYTDAVQQLGSEKMFSLYAAFLHELLQQSDAARTAGIAEGSLESPDNAAVAALLCDVYQQAADKGAISEQMLLDWAALEMGHGQPQAAAAATTRGCQLLPTSCGLWQRRLALLAQSTASQMAQGDSKGERKKARQVLQQAAEESVRRVPAPASAPLWMQLFQALQALNLPCLPLANILSSQLMGLSKAPPEGVMGKAAAAAVQSVWAQDGPEAARLLYRHMLTLAPSGMAIFHAILDLEISGEAGGPSKPGHGRICKVFEAAVDAYGSSDVSLWIRYITYQHQMAQGSGSLYWRACKQLQNADAFVAAFNSLQQASL